MAIIQVSLPADLEQFVADRVKQGGLAGPGDYVIRVLRAEQRQALENELLAGVDELDRGEGRPFTPADWQRLRDRVNSSADGTPP